MRPPVFQRTVTVGCCFLVTLFSISDAATTCTNTFGVWIEAPSPTSAYADRAVVVVDRQLYLLGGSDMHGVLSVRVDKYEPTAAQWTRPQPIPQPVSTAQAASDGRYIWLAGGLQPSGAPSARVWRYSMRTDEWLGLEPLPAARVGGAMVLVERMLFYIGGRNLNGRDETTMWSLDIDDVTSGWKVSGPPPTIPRSYFAAIPLNNAIYAVAGEQRVGSMLRPIGSLEALAFGGAWQSRASLPSPRSHCASSTLAVNGNIVVLGGRDGQAALGSGLEYEAGPDRWRSQIELPMPLYSAAAGFFRNVKVGDVTGDFVVVTSGFNSDGTINDKTWLSQVTLGCKAIPPMAIPTTSPATSDTGLSTPRITSDADLLNITRIVHDNTSSASTTSASLWLPLVVFFPSFLALAWHRSP